MTAIAFVGGVASSVVAGGLILLVLWIWILKKVLG